MDFIEIGSLLSASRHFIIPDYQREYSWEKTQNLTLWADVRELIDNKKAKHFLGALVTSAYQKEDTALAVIQPEQYGLDSTEVFHLLDGQQRLTSISLLIAALLDVITHDEALTETDRSLLSAKLKPLLFDNDSYDDNDNPSPRLFLKEESGKYFYREILNINVSANTDKRFKSVKNMKTAHDVYKEKISEWNITVDTAERNNNYERLISAITNRIQVVDIRCGKNMNEFQVFESLNGKGLNLTAVDRIKSIYLSKARVSNADGSSKWQAICAKLNCEDKTLLHFFTTLFFYTEKRRISKIAIPNQFKTMATETYQSFGALDADLQDAVTRYASLRNAMSDNAETEKVLKDIAKLGQDQIYVPLYAAATVAGLNSDRFIAIAKQLLVYSVRHTICGKPTNALDAEFSKIIGYIKQDATFDDAMKYIAATTESDEDFEFDFARFSFKNASFARYLLEKLEIDRRLEEFDGSPIPDSPSLEHIIPQTINYEDWFGEGNIPDRAVQDSFTEDVICRIGNMALLGQCDNTAASNKNYETKRRIYIDGSSKVKDYGKPASTYKLIKDLIEQYTSSFTPAEVEQRSKALAKKAPAIWPIEKRQ